MKKTHLYGAVAATMLLAPVTANVLAAEEGEVPSETSLETQNSSELSEQPVLPEQTETEEVNLSAVDEAEVLQEVVEQDDSGMNYEPEDDADNFNVEDSAEEDEIPEEEEKTDNEVWSEEKKEEITIPAEEMYIPDPVTLDEEIDIRINYENSETGTLNTWMESLEGIKVTINDRDTHQTVYEKNFAIDLSKFDMSHLSELQFHGGEFYSYFYYDMSDIIATIEKESKLELNGDDDRILSLSLNYDHLNKKWKLNNHHAMDDNFTCLLKRIISPAYSTDSVFDYYPDLGQATEEDLDDEKIIHDFYNSFQSLVVTVDGKEFSQVDLTRDDFVIVKPTTIEIIPERATGGVPNCVRIRIDTNALAEKLNLPKNIYYHISSKHLLEGIEGIIPSTTMYSLTDWRDIFMYFTTSENWKIANNSDSNLKIDYETFIIDKYQKEMDLLTNALKVHIYDISDQNKVTEFEYVPQNGDIYDDIEFTKTGNLVSGHRQVRIDSNEYLKKYEELKNGKYKFAIPQSENLYERLEYNSTSYSTLGYQTELVIYVEKDTLSENQYTNNGIQLSAKANEDLYGLEFKAENTKSDHNFGFDSTNETVGYTLSFVNRQGEEVQRTGAFEVQMPIPTEWAGKVLKVYQVDQEGNKELLSILMDGKVIFTPTTLSTFVLVKEAEPETPIKTEATFSQDGYQVKAESNEDLTGLEIVIDEVEADNNFGLSSDYQTIGYDIHFENDEGIEVSRTGKFTVRIPIPTEFIGKEVRLFHKEQKDSDAVELQFKIIDDKYYEFETTSFSWFIVASQSTTDDNKPTETPDDPSDDNKPTETPDDPTDDNKPTETPTTPVDEENKPASKPSVNKESETRVIPVKMESTKETQKEADTKRSPNTGIAARKTSSMFAGMMSLIGLGFLVGKKRKF